MKIAEKAQLYLGTVIKRVESEDPNETKVFNVVSLKNFNEALGEHYRGADDEQEVHVHESDVSKLILAEERQIVVHLLTRKAVVLPEYCTGYIIPSNFVKVALSPEVQPFYFEWYFNNHPDNLKQLSMLTQGSVVSGFSLKQLKELQINIPSIDKQLIIGDIYELRKKKEALIRDKMALENQLLEEKFIKIIKGD